VSELLLSKPTGRSSTSATPPHALRAVRPGAHLERADGEPALPAGSVPDVAWSEGAAYMGFGEAFTSWSRLLPGGGMVVTEYCCLTDHPSPDAARFWRRRKRREVQCALDIRSAHPDAYGYVAFVLGR
jgi:hypothetical protein